MPKFHSVILIILLLLSINQAHAIAFKDEGLKEDGIVKFSEIIEQSEVHADTSIGNFFHNGQIPSVKNGHDAIWDYRFEVHTPLYKSGTTKGSIVTRVEGFGHLDNNINDFFDDPLIDLPELYLQNDFKVKGMDNKLVFGKFANRRFFDKQEIMSDPFDIGERPFFSSIAGVNSLLAGIQTVRDADQGVNPNNSFGSIQATGSYGFMWSIKDNTGNGFFDRWGYKQSLTVAQLDNFGRNFYGISEVNKNWGDKRPGQFDMGFLFAGSDVFRTARNPGVSGNPAYLMYAGLTQKVTPKLSAYAKYGLLANNNATGQDFWVNNVVSGVAYALTPKDTVASTVVYLNSETLPHNFSHLNSWTHKFNQHLFSTLYATFRYNAAAATPSGNDNNWFIGFDLTAFM